MDPSSCSPMSDAVKGGFIKESNVPRTDLMTYYNIIISLISFKLYFVIVIIQITIGF